MIERRERLRDELAFGLATARTHGLRIVLLFVAVLLPLWGFGELAEEVREGETFFFDQPLLQLAHAQHGPLLDRVFLWFSQVGYLYGVVPLDVLLIVVLAARGHKREGLFAGIAIIGSALLNMGAKHYFGRERPALWTSLAPEHTFSFPSGHAMGSMTLAAVLVLLAWRTRWRWPLLAVALPFVMMVGVSRIYLGVHWPSDILAGWAAALAWCVGVYALLFRGGYRPWQ